MTRETDIFERAVQLALEYHSGQQRKGGGLPYILHPMEVAVIVSTLTDDREVLAAAMLHDVVEDTPATVEAVEERFGPRVAALVASESENKRPEIPAADSWLLRKQEALSELAGSQDPAVRMICLGDKLSNLRSLRQLALQDGDGMWQHFHQKDPRQHGWYYRELAAILKPLADTPAYREFLQLINCVFPAEV